MTGHTAGPWTVDEVSTQSGRAFRIGSGEMLTAGKGCCIIYDDHRPPGTQNERSANATLIAAAPLLLEALKELMGHEPVREDFQSTRRGDHQFEAAKAAWDRARSAIAAATRET